MINILLVDDHTILRSGLKILIEAQDGMQVVAEAGDGRTAMRLTEELSPSVVIMDVAMPNLNGIEATRKIVVHNPKCKVIGLSMHADKRFVLAMLRAGASGYLIKDCAFEELILAIQTVFQNRRFLSQSIADIVVEEIVQERPTAASTFASELTAREREVLQLLAEGKSTKNIAFLLSVSGKTIETHRQHIMNKVGVRSVAELTKYAIREGITNP